MGQLKDRVIIITASPATLNGFQAIKKGDLFYASVSKAMSEKEALELHVSLTRDAGIKSVNTISDTAHPINSEGFKITIDWMLSWAEK